MAKVAITVLVLRVIQLLLAIVFLIFWTWSAAAKFVLGGGAGEYFLGCTFTLPWLEPWVD